MMLLQQIIATAVDERRAGYKVLNHNLQSCGGGKFDWRPYLPHSDAPGAWLPRVTNVRECEQGYHFTLDPSVWNGNVVYLAETPSPMTQQDKQAFDTGRLLQRIFSYDAIDIRIWVRTMYPNLTRADLAGSNLSGADLYRSDLYGADLSGADLSGANLYRADLAGSNLSGADLYRSDLYRADLSGATRRPTDPAIPGWEVVNGMLVKEQK